MNNLAAGTYNVTVTATGGCTSTASTFVNSSIGITTTANGNTTTCGQNNGSITATPTGGSGYTYLWMPGNYTTQTVNNLAAGTYSVTVTATGGCAATASAIVNSSTAITAMTSVTHESCNNCNDGLASVTPSGGSEIHLSLVKWRIKSGNNRTCSRNIYSNCHVRWMFHHCFGCREQLRMPDDQFDYDHY